MTYHLRENLTTAGDPEVGSIGSLGTLKRAHISRNKVSRTSFYLRVGALGKQKHFALTNNFIALTQILTIHPGNFSVFGLGTLIFNGLEIAMHATMNNKNCVDDIVIAHPILQVNISNKHIIFFFKYLHFRHFSLSYKCISCSSTPPWLSRDLDCSLASDSSTSWPPTWPCGWGPSSGSPPTSGSTTSTPSHSMVQ